MRKYIFPGLVLSCLFGLCLPLIVTAQSAEDIPPFRRDDKPGDPPPVPGYDGKGALPPGAEIQGRGPIHEAFAQPGSDFPRPAPVITKTPPEPIEELPPEQKPEGDNVIWIPGYWAWDDDRSDFLWISGFWRIAPLGRKWVPGYWAKVDGGYRWVSGFWASSNQAEVPYLPEPPATIDRGPALPAPGDDYFYVPGNWQYQDRWLWQPGFWCQSRPGYVYTPSRWNWTPRGAVYVNGYWDYSLAGRGVLFAPICFTRPVYQNPGFLFRPSFAVSLNVALGSLWARPGWGYYAFGDYYGNSYSRRGYSPWYSYGPRYRDPLYSYYSVAARNNPGWAGRLATTYNNRVRGTLPAPPRTLSAQTQLLARNRSAASSLQVVQPVTQYTTNQFRIARVSSTDRARNDRIATTYRNAGVARRTEELRTVPRGVRPGSMSLTQIPTARSTPAASVGVNRPTVNHARVVRPTVNAPTVRTPVVGAPARSNTIPRTLQTPSNIGSQTPRIITGNQPPPRTQTTPSPRTITPHQGHTQRIPLTKGAYTTPTPRQVTPNTTQPPRVITPSVPRQTHRIPLTNQTPQTPRYSVPSPTVPHRPPVTVTTPRYQPTPRSAIQGPSRSFTPPHTTMTPRLGGPSRPNHMPAPRSGTIRSPQPRTRRR